MKTLRVIPFITLFLAATTISFAQSTKTETFKVSGNCGMCKNKIEKAAKEAGATSATWSATTKELTVKYNSTSTNTAKIQEKIAAVGYDNAGAKATDEAYDKLHGCCKYERGEASKDKAACCSKDDGKACAEHDGKHDAKAECCKDGKCTKEGHNGADCCKKS